jgi:hypothetical protein
MPRSFKSYFIHFAATKGATSAAIQGGRAINREPGKQVTLNLDSYLSRVPVTLGGLGGLLQAALPSLLLRHSV